MTAPSSSAGVAMNQQSPLEPRSLQVLTTSKSLLELKVAFRKAGRRAALPPHAPTASHLPYGITLSSPTFTFSMSTSSVS